MLAEGKVQQSNQAWEPRWLTGASFEPAYIGGNSICGWQTGLLCVCAIRECYYVLGLHSLSQSAIYGCCSGRSG